MSGARCVRWLLCGIVLGLVQAGAGVTAAMAAPVTLDWDTNPWPSTSPTTLSHAVLGVGNGDVNITFSDPDGALVRFPGGGAPASPTTNATLNTPLNAGQQNLFIRATSNNGPGFITIRFDFTHPDGITDLSFRIYDIDADLSQWLDVLDVTGTALIGGGTLNPDSVTGSGSPSWSWTPGSSTITGAEPNQGNANDNGTATVTFATRITSFEIVYRNGTSPFGNQWVGISDLTFVPEPHAALLWIAAGLAVSAIRRRA